MTFEAVYCPMCAHCHPRVLDAHTLPCGHSMVGAVRVTREVIGKCEFITMKIRNSSQAKARIMSDGNGQRLVEYKKKGAEKWTLISLPAYQVLLEHRAPALAAAFRARRDVRRGAGASFPLS